jgi:hypothetical protein
MAGIPRHSTLGTGAFVLVDPSRSAGGDLDGHDRPVGLLSVVIAQVLTGRLAGLHQ